MADGAAVSLGQLYREVRRKLRAAGTETPDLDARILVCDAVNIKPAALLLRGGDAVPAAALETIEAQVVRRIAGEPVHRIIGRRAFYEHEFLLSAETLEPRPDTEALVELAAGAVRDVVARRGACLFADVGTGTGAIAVSLLALVAEARALAIDISVGALITARKNAAIAGVADRFHALAADTLTAVVGPLELVVSNPPYIRSTDIDSLPASVRDYDPRIALDGGPDGMDFYRALARQSANVLTKEGSVLVEIGFGQELEVVEIFAGEGFGFERSKKDFGGVVRGLWFRRGVSTR